MIVIKLLRPRANTDAEAMHSIEVLLSHEFASSIARVAFRYIEAAAIVNVDDKATPEQMEMAILEGEQKALAGIVQEQNNGH